MILDCGFIDYCPSVLQRQSTEVTAALVDHLAMAGISGREAMFPFLP
jgi:hypothetical protein